MFILMTDKTINDTQFYTQLARVRALSSKCTRKKVGACIVTKEGVVLPGYNGTPSKWCNNDTDNEGNTLPYVIHAELNCILKAAKEGVSVSGGQLYTTLSPCVQCAAMLAQAGIKKVYYDEVYRSNEGLRLLKEHGVECLCTKLL